MHKLALLIALIPVASLFVFAEPQWRQAAAYQFDWDGHRNVQVVLERRVQDGPDTFARLRIRAPGQKEFTLSNANAWVPYASEEASRSPKVRVLPNLITSKYVLVLKAAENRAVLTLFGKSYGSSPGSLDVLELSPSGDPRVVLHREKFGLEDFRDLDGDGVAEMVGYPCLSQGFGNGLLTYDPFNVYKLDLNVAITATLSLPLSKEYNLKHYYGWTGAKCSEDIAVVLHPPRGGKPLVMSTRQAEKLVSGKP
jgi:hypothetical protein